jgi:outer membrane protein assembly factor BamB
VWERGRSYRERVAGLLSSCRYCRVLLVAMTLALVLTILAAMNLWTPLPAMGTWWSRLTSLSQPQPRWDTRADGVPDRTAVLSAGQVVVVSRGFVTAYQTDTGKRSWHYDVYWALPAVDVVVLHRRSTNPDQDNERDRGYSVVDPSTGEVIWGEHEARAVWVFADKILDLSCPDADACVLRARLHRDNGRQLWSVSLPGSARTILGAEPALAQPRDPAGWFAPAAGGTPGLLAPVVGLPVAGRIQVIDTVEGRLVREVNPPDRQTRVVVSGERILLSRAAPGNAGCRFVLDALNYLSGQSQWHAEGLDLGTASGVGCEQRRDPLGAGTLLVAVNTDNNPALLAADSGNQVWSGVSGDRVLATDGELAVVQGADRSTVRVIDLLADGRPTVWSARMGLKVNAAVTQTMVLIDDADQGHLVVLSHRPVVKLAELKTNATVVGYGPLGILLGSGRRIGFVPVASTG